MSLGIYAYALGYLALPNSIPMDSETVVQVVASSPEWVKVAGKTLVALPFTYHTFNGICSVESSKTEYIGQRSTLCEMEGKTTKRGHNNKKEDIMKIRRKVPPP